MAASAVRDFPSVVSAYRPWAHCSLTASWKIFIPARIWRQFLDNTHTRAVRPRYSEYRRVGAFVV